jgi:hypothetical protein
MGGVSSRIEPNHVEIYKKIIHIKDPSVRLSTLQMLMSGPEYIASAKAAGIYPQLLQHISLLNAGRNPGPLPLTQGSAQVQVQAQAQAPVQQQQHTASIQEQQYRQMQQRQPQNQITTYSESTIGSVGASSYNKLYKPRSTEKALSFFQSCLQILGIEESASLSEDLLKKSYKRAAIKSHPDKGGSEKEFEAVTRAYAYLVEVVKRVAGGSGRADAPIPSMDTVQTQRRDTAYQHEAPQTLDPKNLNMGMFNKVFEETRMPEPDEDGYGDWLKDEAGGAGPKNKFGGKFNRDVFNKVFEEDARSNSKSQAIMTYHDPQEIIPVAGVELGRDRPSDYTAPFNADGLQYTDLKNAYTRENTFSSKVANVQVSDRTYDRVVMERKSAPSAYSDAERALMEQAQRQREAQERQRQIRAAEEGMAAQRYAEQLKRRLLVNGSTVQGHQAIADR